jgi:hypothetical protein
MWPSLLDLSDDALVRELHELEAATDGEDPSFQHFASLRSVLSRESWQALTDRLGCDAGPLATTGVKVFPLPAALAGQFLQAMYASPRTRIRRSDFAVGYVSTSVAQCDYLNECNLYHELSSPTRTLMAEFMKLAGPQIADAIGHPFRVSSARQFELVPNRPKADPHLDGWPVAMRKLFVLPKGCGHGMGTTWFKLRDGRELTLDSEKPIWVLFENSVCVHAPVSGEQLRPTIEFDLVPSTQTSLDVGYPGLAGWYPLFPTDKEMHAGNRQALEMYLRDVPNGAPKPKFSERLKTSMRRWRSRSW